MLEFVCALALLTLPAGAPFPVQSANPPAPLPNIVLILADDLGFGDPGCYNDASKIQTPYIDRLAAEGLRFTDAHSPSSVCTPTRYGILTGRYAWRTPLKRSVLWPWDPPLIEEARLTLPEFLRQRGYRTACVGKWHLGWDWPIDDDLHVTDVFSGHTIPQEERASYGRRLDATRPILGGPLAHGFDHYFGDDVPNFPPYAFLLDDRLTVRPRVEKPEAMFGHAGPAAPGWDLSVVLPVLAQRAAGWIDERAAEPERPFFLYLPLTAPHTPIAPSPHFAGRSEAGAYGDWVAEVDWCVGQVLAALERGGLVENTLVIFTSDNGSPQRDGTDMSGPTGSVRVRFDHDPSRPWRGMKSDAWEGGHRVPCLARWPGRVEAGAVSTEPLVQTDFYRTLAALTGCELPETAGEDSFDMSAVLLGHAPPGGVRDHLVHHSGGGVFAIRAGRWKLILGRSSGGFTKYTPPADAPAGQLYDLHADPGEMNNLYRERPEVVEDLESRLEALQQSGRSAPPG